MAQEPAKFERPRVMKDDTRLRELSGAIERTVGAEHTRAGEACAAYEVQGCVPHVVALPGTIEEMAAVLAQAAHYDAAVLPWGNGTRNAYGFPPARCDLVVSTERLNRVLAYDPEDLTISVQTGITHAQLSQALARSRQMLPLDVPVPERATIGGTIATATPGLRRGLYGGVRDLVLGLRVVDASGTILKTGGRVVKNVTGYDMSKLFTGSHGTLGIIAEANFKLVPLPEAEMTIVGVFATQTSALEAAESLGSIAIRPAAVAVAHGMLAADAHERFREEGDHALVAARFPGPRGAVERATREAERMLDAAAALDTRLLAEERHLAFWSTLDNFAQTAQRQPLEALLRLSVLPVECGDVLTLAQTVAHEHGLWLHWLVDSVSGAVWLRTGAEGERADGMDERALAAGLGALQSVLAHRWRNSIMLDCPPGLKSSLDIWGPAPPALDLMQEVKHRFDPARRMNPGRFLPGI